MPPTPVKVRAGAYDVVAFDGRIRVVRRRDGALVGSLPLIAEPTFGAALKETIDAATRPSVEPPAVAAPPEEPKKKRRARSKAKSKTVEPVETIDSTAPEPEELVLEDLENANNETS